MFILFFLLYIGSTFASAFKRVRQILHSSLELTKHHEWQLLHGIVQVLLSRDEMLQLSGVQCVAEVLAQHTQYGHLLLKADIAGTCVWMTSCVVQCMLTCTCTKLCLVVSRCAQSCVTLDAYLFSLWILIFNIQHGMWLCVINVTMINWWCCMFLCRVHV